MVLHVRFTICISSPAQSVGSEYHAHRSHRSHITLSLPARDQRRHNRPRVKYLETTAEHAESFSPELPDFSLIIGGPLFQLLRRAHLSGDSADLVWRRMIALAGITWLPLLARSIGEGHAWGDTVKVPFLLDVDVHAR